MAEASRAEDLSRDHAEARLLKLYEESSHVVTHFWEWRHKVILLASTTLALVFAVTSWMYRQGLGGAAMAFPLIAGGAMSFMFVKFDRRNGMIIQACYDSAISIEKAMQLRSPAAELPDGVYKCIQASREKNDYDPKRWTYGWVLRRAYIALSVVLLALGLTTLGIAAFEPDLLRPAFQAES